MFHIRPATPADITSVDALLARSFPRLLQGDYAPSMLVLALPKISRAQPDLVSCGTYYLVHDSAGTLMGAGGWTAEAPGSGAVTRGEGHIRHVATDPEAIRRGVGRALVDHIIATTRDHGLRRLHCLSTRTAVPFYRAMGFEPLKDVTVPLGHGIDFPAVTMERSL
ncbi:GNAT family N-acetyltransferase [Pseudooctadecabacter sp.]|uniref:GNAT family N-acetyltransferase n=1 Tax=Pseudooctadecabacter sp. TaxID=1966338 RepID=UPI0025D4CAC0|nr:GNAT family N-acetyltransferase [Pseudooctadecabacter sp.]